jgi:hypothetical protein
MLALPEGARMNGLEIAGQFKVLMRQIADQVPVTTRITLKYDGFILTVSATGDRMAYTLPVDHEVEVQVAYVDAKGNPAPVDGDPVWSSSDAAIITVTADTTNAMQAMVTPVGPIGTAQVKVEADADLGAGVTSLVTLMDVTIVAGQAVAGTITPVGAATPV